MPTWVNRKGKTKFFVINVTLKWDNHASDNFTWPFKIDNIKTIWIARQAFNNYIHIFIKNKTCKFTSKLLGFLDHINPTCILFLLVFTWFHNSLKEKYWDVAFSLWLDNTFPCQLTYKDRSWCKRKNIIV